jgi:cytochrome oxidase assembly protein ShyY1
MTFDNFFRFIHIREQLLIPSIEPDLIVSWDREAKGVPIGRAAEVNLRNNHTQYIFTWYASPIPFTFLLPFQ